MAVYKVPRHVWRTVDDRLVLDGHPEAAFLAYPRGTEMTDGEALSSGVLAAVQGPTEQAAEVEQPAKTGPASRRARGKE